MAKCSKQNKPVHDPDTSVDHLHHSITIMLTRDSDLQLITYCPLK
jgi:hypothetical protein